MLLVFLLLGPGPWSFIAGNQPFIKAHNCGVTALIYDLKCS
jgi:hypothetical protein